MDLQLNINLASEYKSNAQITRVLTEDWVMNNGYCPNCGNVLTKFKNNRPVADFFCSICREEFELKSKNGKTINKKIVDGAYSTMIDRILSENNPNFFFLTFDKSRLQVTNFLIIPNFFFLPGIIEKRKPLSSTAQRAGWIGCNINLMEIPETGRIYLIKETKILSKAEVLHSWNKVSFVKEKNAESKGWILEVMKCVDSIPNNDFSLKDVYKFEGMLKEKYPKNNFIKDKIRQQLQIIRDNGLIDFVGHGKYRKIK